MDKTTQLFKAVFGSAWEKLPPVFQKRYSHRPYSNEIISLEGKMDIHFSKLMACFMPIFRLFHILVPYTGKNIPVHVDLCSKDNSDGVYFLRTFYFPNRKPYQFNSHMKVTKENDVIEQMFLGLGWKTYHFYDDKKVIMRHKNYVWKLFGLNIPIPLELLIGKGHAEEEMINNNSYKVTMTISHPLFGVMYSYSGELTFIS